MMPASSPSPIFLLFKHLDVSTLSKDDFQEILDVVRRTPLDPNEVVIEKGRRKKMVEKTLLYRFLESVSRAEKGPKQSGRVLMLVQALIDRGVPTDLPDDVPDVVRFHREMPLIFSLLHHHQDPQDRPSLAAEMELGVQLLERLGKGGGSGQCLKELKDMVQQSGLEEIEGLHPAVWMALQATPRISTSNTILPWRGGWRSEQSAAESQVFFNRMIRKLEQWALESLGPPHPQLLLLEASVRPRASKYEGMERWLSSPGEENGAQRAFALVSTLPDQVRRQAIAALLGAAEKMVHYASHPQEMEIAHTLIQKGVAAIASDPAPGVHQAGSALWEGLNGSVGPTSIRLTAQALAHAPEGVRQGLLLWARFIDSPTPASHAAPTEWVGEVLGCADMQGQDLGAHIEEVSSKIKPALEQAREAAQEKASCRVVLDRIESLLLSIQMDKAMAPLASRRAPGPRL